MNKKEQEAYKEIAAYIKSRPKVSIRSVSERFSVGREKVRYVREVMLGLPPNPPTGPRRKSAASDPTPEEIRVRAAMVRQSWTPSEYYRRAVNKSEAVGCRHELSLRVYTLEEKANTILGFIEIG
jgi:hypothetical protein